ncbi:MAG: cyclic nucleotide-binding domain-containing protein [Gammaproteobacteria bacterium]|nr:cyclic nucleotide-binding domain-containing protein [Gammaproteobacteria bacterium]MDH3857397.1 cyclic nucleotide-binding domain-containing protein [Gammaproteobacteria bacterium]
MSKQSIEDYLSDHAFFSGMDDSYVKFLSDSATELQMKMGDVLFQYGKPADKFYLLREGQMSIQVPALMGPALDIQTLGNDQILGWSWLIPPYRWSFMARALEDSDLIEFDGSAILARCQEDPKFGYELFKRFAALMSERLDAARQKMMDQWNPPGFA